MTLTRPYTSASNHGKTWTCARGEVFSQTVDTSPHPAQFLFLLLPFTTEKAYMVWARVNATKMKVFMDCSATRMVITSHSDI
jgi:hypothetical protein